MRLNFIDPCGGNSQATQQIFIVVNFIVDSSEGGLTKVMYTLKHK